MNQSIKYSPTGYYDTHSGNIRTVDGDTVEIDHQLIIGDIPVDVSNDDLISVDNLGRLYSVPKVDIGGGGYDQDLNTFDSVEFAGLTLPTTPDSPVLNEIVMVKDLAIGSDIIKQTTRENLFLQDLTPDVRVSFDRVSAPQVSNLHPDVAFGVDINRNGISSLVIDSSYNGFPKVSLTEKTVGTPAQLLQFGSYYNNAGLIIASDSSYVQIKRISGESELCIFMSDTPQVIGTTITSNKLIVIFDKDFVVFNVKLLLNIVAQNNLIDKILVYDGNEVKYRDVSSLPANNPFDQDLNTTDNVQFNSLKLDSVVVNNLATQMLVLDGNDLKYRDVGTIGGGDVSFSGVVPSDNVIARYDGITGLLIQSSGVSIDDLNNLITSGNITCQTSLIAPELDADLVVVKSVNDTLKSVALNNLFGQNLSPLSDVVFNRLNTGQGLNELFQMDQDVLTTSNTTFNNIFSNGLIGTDTITEQTINNGVDITTWNIKPQTIQSSGAVSPTDPLTINLNISGDNNSIMQVNASSHDNNGILFDMNHFKTGTVEDYISGSVAANVFINKQNDALNFLFDTGIAAGGAITKAGMTTTMGMTKTSINLNQTTNINAAVFAPNLGTDTGINTNFLTLSASNQIEKRVFEPTYGSIGINGNVIETVIVAANSYVVLNFIGTTSPVRNCILSANTITPAFSGVYEIQFHCSLRPANLATTKQYDVAVFANASLITDSVMCITTTDSDQMSEASSSFFYNYTVGQVLTVMITNRTNTENVILACGKFLVKRMLD